MAKSMVDAIAACDQHLPNLMRQVIADNKSDVVRVTNLAKPHENYSCECRVPAHWYVRIVADSLTR